MTDVLPKKSRKKPSPKNTEKGMGRVDVDESPESLIDIGGADPQTDAGLVELGCVRVPLKGEIDANIVLKDILERERRLRGGSEGGNAADLAGGDDTERSLLFFGFTEKEARIIYMLLTSPEAADKGLDVGKISEMTGIARSNLYRLLKKLNNRGWIAVKSRKPVRYGPIGPREFEAKIKSSLKEAYDLYMARKSTYKSIIGVYYSALGANYAPTDSEASDVSDAEAEENGIYAIADEISKIPPTFRDEYREILLRILRHFPGTILTKFESNRTVKIKKETLTFVLSTCDFAITGGDSGKVFGGIQFYEIKSHAKGVDILKEIHLYGRGILGIQYKMANKGYLDEMIERKGFDHRFLDDKAQEVHSDDMVAGTGSGPQYLSDRMIIEITESKENGINADMGPRSMTGLMVTRRFTALPDLIVGYWIEDSDLIPEIERLLISALPHGH